MNTNRTLLSRCYAAMLVACLVAGAALAQEKNALIPTSSGTAFVVNENGYLLTCAHVVSKAVEVRVMLANKSTPARVLGVDEAHDLALLKVEDNSLTALPLGSSRAPELGEEVRAFGFPLAFSYLGTSIKVTRGTISGIETHNNMSILQLDAAVNPGNSGGPLVNRRGEVVGVINIKLRGAGLGFAVPAQYAQRLLQAHRVPFTPASTIMDLDGPDLAKLVSPSVLLVVARLEKSTGSAAARPAARSTPAQTSSSTPVAPPNPSEWVRELSPQAATDYLERRAQSLRAADPSPLRNWLTLWDSALNEPNRTRVELDYVELLLTGTPTPTARREARERLQAIAARGLVDPQSRATCERLQAQTSR
jgi:hypothetical protein